jgi:hypothetical protein
MLDINSVSVSAPHNDIEHMKIANLNRRSLAVQPRRKFVVGHALVVDGECTARCQGKKEINYEGTILYGPRDVRFEECDQPITAMTHIAIQETVDSKAVDSMEKVSDDQYRR